jgi:subtilisin family serine protease
MFRKGYAITLILLISFSLFTVIHIQQAKTNSRTENHNIEGRTAKNHVLLDGLTKRKFQQHFVIAGESPKIDTLLRNYSMLRERNYIENGKLRVIILPTQNKDSFILNSQHNLDLYTLAFNVQKFNATIVNVCKHLPFITLQLPYECIIELSKQNFIAYISLDIKYYACLNESVSIVKPPETWHQIEMRHGYEINGSGVKIAILDTGIDKTHLDLDDLDDNPQTIDPKVVAERCFTDENHTTDGYGHGTHCAGIAAGTGKASNYTYVGVASAAQLLNGKVLTDEGWGYSSWIINGIEWAVTENADIISMSFGSSENTDGTDPLSVAVDWAIQQGSVCVVAAGNGGSKGMFSIGTPGCSSYAITVGATDKTDHISSFSSLGYTADFEIKPDVLAPGVDIISCRAQGTNMGTPINVNYTKASGTSMATPHISGLCALILQIHPNWNPQTVKYSILNGAVDLGYHTYQQGSGRADICNSLSKPLVVSSPINFKRIHLFEKYSQNVTIQNVNETYVNVTLSSYIKTLDGLELKFISIDRRKINLAVNQKTTIQVTINFSDWIEGFFEGKLIITANPDVIHVPLLSTVLSALNLTCKDEQGQKVKDVKWQIYNSTPYKLIDESTNPSPTFFLKHGTYTLVAYNTIIYVGNKVDYEGAFLLYKNVTISIGSDICINISLNIGKKIKIDLPTPIECYAKAINNYGYYGVDAILQKPYIYLSGICSLAHLQKPIFSFYGSPTTNKWMENWISSEKLLPYTFDTYFYRWNLKEVMKEMPDQIVLEKNDFAEYTIEIYNCKKFSDEHTYVWFNCFTDSFGTGLWSGFLAFPGSRWRCYVQPIKEAEHFPQPNWGFALSPENHDYSYFILRKPIAGEEKKFKLGYSPNLPQQFLEISDQIILQCPLRGWMDVNYVEIENYYNFELLKDKQSVCNKLMGWQSEVYLSDYMKRYGSGQYILKIFAETSQEISPENLIEYKVFYNDSKLLCEQDILPPTIDCINCSAFQIGTAQKFRIKVNDNSGIKNVSVFLKPDNGNWTNIAVKEESKNLYSVNFTILDPNVKYISLRINITDVNGNSIKYETSPFTINGVETNIQLYFDNKCEVNDTAIVCGNLTILNGDLSTPVYLSVSLNDKKYSVLTNYFAETKEYHSKFAFTFKILQNTLIKVTFPGFYVYLSTSCEGQIFILLHDIAIIKIILDTKHVYQGDSFNVSILIQNRGNFTESFNVILYANSSIIENTTIINLPPSNTVNLTAVWNTENVTLGNYFLQGYITAVSREVNKSNNVYVYGIIEVRIFDVDFNGDSIVNALDLRIAAICFEQDGSSPFDLNFDNVVDGNDLEIIIRNFRK